MYPEKKDTSTSSCWCFISPFVHTDDLILCLIEIFLVVEVSSSSTRSSKVKEEEEEKRDRF